MKTGLSASRHEADHHLERKEQDDEREAVCRLMTNSNLVDCKTGRSAGFAPLRLLREHLDLTGTKKG